MSGSGRCTYRGRWRRAVRAVPASRSRHSPTRRPAASSPRPPPPCPSNSAAPATGTTGTAGCATPRFTLQALLGAGYARRRRPGASGCCGRSPATRPTCRSCTASTGGRRLPEYELPWLAGYAGSTPVRVGNAAADQFQLDVWGEVLDALHLARDSPAWHRPTTPGSCSAALLELPRGPLATSPTTACGRCAARGGTFVHSKVMAWAGVDRAVQAVERRGLDGPVERWRGAARADPRRGLRARVRRRPQHVHPVLRLARAGRGAAADPAGRVPAGRRPAGRRHRRRDRARAVQDGFLLRYDAGRRRGRRRTARRRGRLPRVHVLVRRRARAASAGARGRAAVRAAAGAAQRRRAARRGVRHDRATARREHPAGLQPRLPRQDRTPPRAGHSNPVTAVATAARPHHQGRGAAVSMRPCPIVGTGSIGPS